MTLPQRPSSPGDFDREIQRTEAEIARAREEVVSSVLALREEISRKFDWREWVLRKPILAVVAAFGLGALLGGWQDGPRRRRR